MQPPTLDASWQRSTDYGEDGAPRPDSKPST
jgi:hypothetical protein